MEHLAELVNCLHDVGGFVSPGRIQEALTMPLPCGGAQSTSPTVALATLSSLEATSWPKALSCYKVQLIIFAFCIKQRKEKRSRCSSVAKYVFSTFARDSGVISQLGTHKHRAGAGHGSAQEAEARGQWLEPN